MVRDGIPLNVVDFLKNPESYELKEITPESASEKSSTKRTLSNPITSQIETSDQIVSSQPHATPNDIHVAPVPVVHKEVPHFLKDAVGVDCVIYPVDGDGLCLYNSFAAHVYGDPKKSPDLRREAHKFIVKNWSFYKQFWALPYEETIGVGDEKYTVRITTETALKHFLLSEHSLKVWSSTEIDITNLANMFNTPISVFTYNLPSYPSTNWNTFQPDSVIGPNSEYRNWGVVLAGC